MNKLEKKLADMGIAVKDGKVRTADVRAALANQRIEKVRAELTKLGIPVTGNAVKKSDINKFLQCNVLARDINTYYALVKKMAVYIKNEHENPSVLEDFKKDVQEYLTRIK